MSHALVTLGYSKCSALNSLQGGSVDRIIQGVLMAAGAPTGWRWNLTTCLKCAESWADFPDTRLSSVGEIESMHTACFAQVELFLCVRRGHLACVQIRKDAPWSFSTGQSSSSRRRVCLSQSWLHSGVLREALKCIPRWRPDL